MGDNEAIEALGFECLLKFLLAGSMVHVSTEAAQNCVSVIGSDCLLVRYM